MYELIANSIPIAIVASIPLLLALEAELLAQRAATINPGTEGMILTAAMTAAFAAQTTGSVTIGFLGGIAGAMVITAIFGVFAIALRADQIVTGTAINLLALGGTSFVYREVAAFQRPIPQLHTDIVSALSWIVAPLILGAILWNTSFGLRLPACGENPEALAATRRPVPIHRRAAPIIQALPVGIGGAY